MYYYIFPLVLFKSEFSNSIEFSLSYIIRRFFKDLSNMYIARNIVVSNTEVDITMLIETEHGINLSFIEVTTSNKSNKIEKDYNKLKKYYKRYKGKDYSRTRL